MMFRMSKSSCCNEQTCRRSSSNDVMAQGIMFQHFNAFSNSPFSRKSCIMSKPPINEPFTYN
ncbi:hypothetical protein DERP_006979 [Dermatophagoides pteronyssinus]|uniref:Uncharacterized protein n=1 Tax=Dermatophagoides pteronyssinus TaxID=6956 RepID=A0ABQ8JTT6_DERPT|nr:hypothetical protein DERP_006979 [Dermatophagoides pteronyssinus]